MKTVRILSILFLLFCLAFVFASCDNERPQENAETEKTAETGQETGLGGLAFDSNGDGTCSVSGIGSCTDVDLRIPVLSPEGDRVTGIKDLAFCNNKRLVSVSIPDGVTSVGRFAFYGCRELTSVVISDSVKTLDLYCFHGCANLTSVTLGSGVKMIKQNAFADCSSLSSLTLPESVRTIGPSAFSGCTGLTSVTVPNSVQSIGLGAFSGCSGLTEITVPFVGAKAGVTATDEDRYPLGYIFGTQDYPGGIETEQEYRTGSDTTVSETYYIPSRLSSVTVTGGKILHGAFSGCAGLTEITLPLGVTEIGSMAFSGCAGLTKITLPLGVTEIGSEAFSGCAGLTDFTIPTSVTSIGNGAFSSCPNLARIIATGNTAYKVRNRCLIEIETKRLIWGSNSSMIPTDGSVTTIASLAFTGNNSKSYSYSVNVPSGVTRIEDLAFYGCTTLGSLDLPESLESIGANAFSLCHSLSWIGYRGTRAQWNAIEKGADWNKGTGNYTVSCSNGLIEK